MAGTARRRMAKEIDARCGIHDALSVATVFVVLGAMQVTVGST